MVRELQDDLVRGFLKSTVMCSSHLPLSGRSARFLAVAKGHAEVVQILSEHQGRSSEGVASRDVDFCG